MNKTIETIYQLKSTHGNFKQKKVPKKILNEILNGSIKAATGGLLQPYSIIVIDDKDNVKKLTTYSGSAAIVFCVDFNRVIKTAFSIGESFKCDNILTFMQGITDTFLAAQTAAIISRALNIDSLFTNSLYRIGLDIIAKKLNLPEKHCLPLITLVLGYEDKKTMYYKGRLKGKGIFHFNKYCELDDKEIKNIINQYDDNDNHMNFDFDWKKENVPHYLNWYFSKWWNGDENPERIDQMNNYLKKIGFWFFN